MSYAQPRTSDPRGGVHPAVLNRQLRDLSVLGGVVLVAVALAMGVVIAFPTPNYVLTLLIVLALLIVVALVVNRRLERSVAFIVVYLGCINGPFKLIASGGALTSGVQDVLMLSVCLGIGLRLLAARRAVNVPPLFGWVFAFVLVVLIEAFNPQTAGLLKTLGGYRQQLEWVPFFIFGYLLMRSKGRFHKAFLMLGVITALNGAVATVQTQQTPQEIASLGAGYQERVFGHAARKYISEGEAHVRPLGLGSDAGFGGGLAVITLPAVLALLATMKRRRWIAGVLVFGAMFAAITSLGRLQLVGTLLSGLAFALLSIFAGRQLGRPLKAALVVTVLAVPVLAVFVSVVGEGVFSRYASLSPEKAAGTATGYKKSELESIPHELAHNPFGFGLGTAGAVSGFGGKVTEVLEGHNVNSETEPSFLVKELGLPGLLVWFGFLFRLITLGLRRLKDVRDPELQAYLTAMVAPLVAFLFMSYDGPVSVGATGGAFYWFSAGVCAYWLVGRGLAQATRKPEPEATGQPALALAM